MARLPEPGRDAGNWGKLLNDFLDVEHNADGTLKQSSTIRDAEQTANKGQSNGYPSLDATAKIPATQLGGTGASSNVFLRGDRTWAVPDVAEASLTSKGGVRLAGDLAGTADAPTVPTKTTGPASSTANALVRFDGTTGKLVKDSSTTLADDGTIGWAGRQDFQSTRYTITNPAMRFTQEDSESTDDHAKGLLLEWGGNMTAGVNYPYGIATNAYAANPNATFTVPSTGYKKWGWIMTHYQSPSSTGEAVHQHLNLETVKADYLTVITRLQVSFGEDIALVSFPNSNVKVFNDMNFQIGTDDSGAFLKHDTALARVVVSGSTPWNFTGSSVKIGPAGAPAGKLHVERTDDGVGVVVRNTNAVANGSANVLIQSAAAGGTALQSGLTGESVNRFSMNTSGKMEWGSGSATRDVNLYRVSGGVVGTDNTLSAKGLALGIISRTSAYTATATDHTILASSASGAYTVTLPSAAALSGREYVIKKTDSSANTVTVGTTSSQTIDGLTTYALSAQYKYVRVQSDGSNWFIIGNN